MIYLKSMPRIRMARSLTKVAKRHGHTSARAHTHAHTVTHTYKHAHTFTRLQTHNHIHPQANVRTRTHAHRHTRIYTQAQTHTHTYACSVKIPMPQWLVRVRPYAGCQHRCLSFRGGSRAQGCVNYLTQMISDAVWCAFFFVCVCCVWRLL